MWWHWDGPPSHLYLPAGLRNRKSPRLRTGRGCVRDRLEAVEIPLKRTKKSQNARIKFLLFLVGMGKNLADQSRPRAAAQFI